MGIALSLQFHLDDAGKQYERAFALFEAMAHQQGVIAALHNMAVNELRLGRCRKALAISDEVRRRSTQTNAPLFLETATINASSACLRCGDFPRAYELASEAVILTTRTNSQNRAAAIDVLGQAEVELGHYDAAIAHFEQAIALTEESGLEALASDSLANLANAYLRNGRIAEAWRPSNDSHRCSRNGATKSRSRSGSFG